MTNVTPLSQTESGECVILGAGVGGLTAAALLAEQGVAVTLVTGEPTHSNERAAAGSSETPPDPGPETLAAHGGDLLMGCHGHLLALHRRLRLESHIRWERELRWIGPGGEVASLAGDDLPAPLHMLRSLISLSVFTAGQRMALLKGMLALMQVRPDQPIARRESLDQWLVEHRQPRAVIDRFWSPLSRLACGAPADRVVAGEAIRVLQQGLLEEESTWQLGISSLTHQALVRAVRQRIEAAGGRVLTGGGLSGIEIEGDRAVGVHLADGQQLACDYAVLALDPRQLAAATRSLAASDGRFAGLATLEPVPRLEVHLDAPRAGEAGLMPGAHLIAMEGVVPIILRRGESPAAGDAVGEALQAVLPDAGDWIDRPPEQIRAEVEAAAGALLPGAEQGLTATHLDRRPCFSYRYPADAGWNRPAIAGGIDNLYLAAGWCDTGLPPGLEGAAAAGATAAQRVLARLGREAPAPREIPARPGLLYRLLSG